MSWRDEREMPNLKRDQEFINLHPSIAPRSLCALAATVRDVSQKTPGQRCDLVALKAAGALLDLLVAAQPMQNGVT
jgi:hypothetical protein